MKEQNFVSVVLYCRNVDDAATRTLDAITQVLQENCINREVICVDDFDEVKK